MSRKRRRKKKQTTHVVTIVLLLVIVVLGFNIIKLYQKNQAYAAKQATLEEKYQVQEERKEELTSFEKFTHTVEYVEQVAREKLGMVFKNEIIFKSDD